MYPPSSVRKSNVLQKTSPFVGLKGFTYPKKKGSLCN